MVLTYEYLQKLGHSFLPAIMNSKPSQCWEWLAFYCLDSGGLNSGPGLVCSCSSRERTHVPCFPWPLGDISAVFSSESVLLFPKAWVVSKCKHWLCLLPALLWQLHFGGPLVLLDPNMSPKLSTDVRVAEFYGLILICTI